MTFEEISKLYNVELPFYFERYFDEFINLYRPNTDLINDDELNIIKEATEVDDKCLEMIKNVNNALKNNDTAHLLASYFIYVTIYKIKPWENLMHSEEMLSLEGFHNESVNLFFVAKQLAYTLIIKKPPVDLNLENTKAFKGYSSSFYEEHGYYGIPSYHWNMQCAGGSMFMFGTLKFSPSYFTDDFYLLKKGDEYISIVHGSYNVDKYQALTSDPSKKIVTTFYKEDEKNITAFKISKDGKVALTPTTFNKDEYEIFLKGFDDTIDIHIPSTINYCKEVMEDSYIKALNFYKDYYPNHHIKAIVAFSWLYSPELNLVFNEDSKILKVQKDMYLFPTCGTFDENLEFIRSGSSLANKIKEKIKEGRSFHFGIMVVPVDTIKK